MQLLIAEDDATARAFLAGWVKKWDYQVVEASNGEEAWAILSGAEPPPLALLDWMMPGIDGPEICRRVREQNATPYQYIILVTSRKEREDFLTGLDAGADDFLTKPVDPDALRARLNVAARVRRYEENLRKYATQMESLAEDRARQLIHADRLATIGTMAAGIIHEVNNPLGYISGNVQILERFFSEAGPLLQSAAAHAGKNRKRFERIIQEGPRIFGDMDNGLKRIERIINGLRRFARSQGEERQSCDPNACVEDALELCRNRLKHHVEVIRELAETPPAVRAQPHELSQVLVNLFINAADAMEERGHGTLRIRSTAEPKHVLLTVEDDGPGIPPEKMNEIWEPFYTSKPMGKGTGLGLSICRGIVQRYGGTIKSSKGTEGGACFEIRMPIASARDAEDQADSAE